MHFEVVGRDPQRLQAFYGKAFDWNLGEPIPTLNGYALAKPNAAYGIDGVPKSRISKRRSKKSSLSAAGR